MTKRTTLAHQRRGHPHAQVHLPPLTGEEALLLCNLLDRAICALWRAHGHAMADLLACLDPDTPAPEQPPVSVATGDGEPWPEDLF